MGVVMIIAYLNVFQHTEGVVSQHRAREIERQQVRCDSERIQSHQAGGEARRYLSGNPGLVQPDDALLMFSHPEQQDAGRWVKMDLVDTKVEV
jgi:hypothetical protein